MLLLKITLFAICSSAVSADYCGEFNSCQSCVEQPSWLFCKSCRWCRVTYQCHAYMSVQNRGNGDEDIHSQVANWRAECEAPLRTKFRYDVNLSLKSLYASAAAYFQPKECARLLLPDFHVFKEFGVKCSILDKSNCSSFLAVSEKDEIILVAFRGSETFAQVLTQVVYSVLLPTKQFLGGNVEHYFLTAFELLWKEMSIPFQQLRSYFSNYQVLVAGHSLGGAIASLASLYMAHHKVVPIDQLIVYTFGMPRVGDDHYSLQHSKNVPHSMRVVNGHDPVPHYPTRLSPPFKAPNHHGLEVHYENATSVDSPWKECRGLPLNEDSECSWGYLKHRMDDHVYYFGIRVGGHCKKLLEKVNI